MPNLFQRLHEQLAVHIQPLPDKPEETVTSTLHALWQLAAGQPMSAALAMQDALPELTPAQRQLLLGLVERRQNGTPLAHITGRARFMDLELLAGPEALVPRRETEILARGCLAVAQELGDTPLMIIDVCTGSGNVALALARHLPNARVFAADLSTDAIAFARRNAEHLGLAQRVEFRCGDLLAPFATPDFLGRVDLITCNPPYISSAKVDQMPAEISAHEPRLAFDGGPFGIALLMRVIEDAPKFLRPGGWLGFETGLGQGPGMLKRLQKSGLFQQTKTLTDTTGTPRALLAQHGT